MGREDRILLVGGEHHGEWVSNKGRMLAFPAITGLELGWAVGEDDFDKNVPSLPPERVGPTTYYEMRELAGKRVYVLMGERPVA